MPFASITLTMPVHALVFTSPKQRGYNFTAFLEINLLLTSNQLCISISPHLWKPVTKHSMKEETKEGGKSSFFKVIMLTIKKSNRNQ